MAFNEEVTARKPLLRSQLTAARTNIDAIKTTLAALRRVSDADEKDRATIDSVVQKVNAAGAQLEGIERMLADLGPSEQGSRDG